MRLLPYFQLVVLGVISAGAWAIFRQAWCLAAGMDDYISKPFDEEALADVLDRWLDIEQAAEAAARQALPGLGSEPRLRTRSIEIFQNQSPPKLEAMRRALADEDAKAMAANAHSLAGNAGYVGAAHLSSLCSRLEDLARQGSLTECRDHLREVEGEFGRAVTELREVHATRGDGGPARQDQP